MKNNTDFKIAVIIISIGIAMFLICFGLSFSDSSDKENKIIEIIKRIEKIEQTLQNAQA